MTIIKLWKLLTQKPEKPKHVIRKAQSRRRPKGICKKCNQPWSDHLRVILKEDIGLQDFRVECREQE